MTTTHSPAVVLALALACLAACGGGGGGGGGGGSGTAQTTAEAPKPAPPTTPAPRTPTEETSAPQEEPAQGAAPEVDLLVLFTAGVATQFADPELRIAHMVNVANDVLTESGVDGGFTLADHREVDYPDGLGATTALDDLTHATHPAFADVAAWRDATAADLVVLVRPYANDGYCGYAWVGGYLSGGDFSSPAEADFGFAVVAANCSDYTLGHELGHNLGLAHSRREEPDGGTWPYSVGHGVDQDFVTLMASPEVFNAPRLPRLASPDLACNAQPCGVPHSDAAHGADAARTLRNTLTAVARYREREP